MPKLILEIYYEGADSYITGMKKTLDQILIIMQNKDIDSSDYNSTAIDRAFKASSNTPFYTEKISQPNTNTRKYASGDARLFFSF